MAEKGENGRYGPAAIAGWRDEYVTGNESLTQFASRIGVPLKTLERHSQNRRGNAGKTWAELRAEFRADVTGEVIKKTSESAAKVRAKVSERAGDVALLALDELKRRLTPEQPGAGIGIETKDLVQAAKLATTIKIELGGDPAGVPVDIREKLGGLTLDELKALAEGS